MQEHLSVESLIGQQDAKEMFANSNMYALYADLDPMEKLHVPEIIKQNPNPLITVPTKQALLTNSHNDHDRNYDRNNTLYKEFRSLNNNLVRIINPISNITSKPQKKYITPAYQWRAAREFTELAPPENHSMLQSFISALPPYHHLTEQEQQLLTYLDLNLFKPQTPINIDSFTKYTKSHPNQALIAYIINGLNYGFRLGFTGERKKNIMANLSSLDLSPKTLPLFIQKEVELGKIAGPFSLSSPPIDKFMVNPLGLVEKRYTDPIEYRVITHHSAPRGNSVNDGILKHEFQISFDTLKHAVRWIRYIGKGALLTKVDIKDAYRNLPVNPIDQLLQGIIYDNKLYFDKALAFGSRSSCGIFCRFADVLAWIAFDHGIPAIIHYVDDYLIISPPYKLDDKEKFLRLLKDINVPVKTSKLEGPATTITYLGFIIDTTNMMASLTKERQKDLLNYLRKWINKKSAHSREIRSLVGYLLWACQVLPKARPFVQRFLDF